MLHDNETLPLKKSDQLAVQWAEMRMVRWMCGVKVTDAHVVSWERDQEEMYPGMLLQWWSKIGWDGMDMFQERMRTNGNDRLCWRITDIVIALGAAIHDHLSTVRCCSTSTCRPCFKRDCPQWRHSCQHCPATFTRSGKLVGHLWMEHRNSAGKDVYAEPWTASVTF